MARALPHMTRAAGIGPLHPMLEQAAGGRATAAAFRACGVPETIVAHPTQPMPMPSMVALFGEAARRAGDPLFGLRVGRAMPSATYGTWVRYAIAAPTLREALIRISEGLRHHQSGGRVTLAEGAVECRFAYVRPHDDPARVAAHSDHVVPPMIGLFHPYLGAHWLPDRIVTDYPDDGAMARRAALVPTDWQPGGTGVALVFPSALLDTRRRVPPSADLARLTAHDVQAEAALMAIGAPSERLAALVSMGLLGGTASLDETARLLGRSTRALQRDLRASGVTFREVLDRVRTQKAQAMLRETGLTVTEIALSLGYQDPANFTRAFRRATGRSPSSVRAAMRLPADARRVAEPQD